MSGSTLRFALEFALISAYIYSLFSDRSLCYPRLTRFLTRQATQVCRTSRIILLLCCYVRRCNCDSVRALDAFDQSSSRRHTARVRFAVANTRWGVYACVRSATRRAHTRWNTATMAKELFAAHRTWGSTATVDVSRYLWESKDTPQRGIT